MIILLQANVNWTQLLQIGGASIVILAGCGVIIYRKIIPMIETHLIHRRKVDEVAAEALRVQLAASSEFLKQQVISAGQQRTEEVRLFLTEVNRATLVQQEQRREFLEELRARDNINQQQNALLSELTNQVKGLKTAQERASRRG